MAEMSEISEGKGEFVYVEHIDKLRNEQEDLQVQLRALKQNVASLEKVNAEAQTRNQHRWRITKATALVALLATLAVIQEQHERVVAINDTLFHIAPHARIRHIDFNTRQDISANTPLMMCFVLGLPYLIFAMVLYVIHTLDLGDDEPEFPAIQREDESTNTECEIETSVESAEKVPIGDDANVKGAELPEVGEESEFAYPQLDAECVD